MRLPFADRLLLDSPALSSLPGQNPTQDASCPAEGKALAHGPISATICCAESTPNPGSSERRTMAASRAFIASAIILSSSVIWASIRSRRCRYSFNTLVGLWTREKAAETEKMRPYVKARPEVHYHLIRSFIVKAGGNGSGGGHGIN